ncbi:hypothetical protein GL263_13310 [Streptomyces durbertensis]|uniref:Uncharacterized protein n=1 Tax=Streptomyces durbertensis TaxID=2448886 RepID=A0ABR6EGT4_9ACTN|nr:DUF6571 family protein [Streptomyces durbertensis]MBB1244535.1 hypothetical protein [Streptomyces durbertensis]
MVKYADAKYVDYRKLSSAAESWGQMARKYSMAVRAYETDVKGKLERSGWRGDFANAARVNISDTCKEIEAAESEARAVASILREGSRKLASLLKELDAKEAEIRRAGLHVAADGKVWGTVTPKHVGESRTANAAEYRQQVLDQQMAELNARIRKWQRELDDIVRRIGNFDTDLKVSLDKATAPGGSGTAPRFNGNASADLERVKIKRGNELITRLNSGEPLSAGEREELRAISDDAARDRGLSKRFLNAVGTDSFLRLSGWLQYMKATEKGNTRADYAEIAKNMAGVLASATRKEDDAREWAAKFKEVGTRAYEWNENGRAANPSVVGGGYRYSLKGYQALMTIVKEGEGYSKHFLHMVADDIREAEKNDRRVWVTHPSRYPRGAAVDPLDAALGAMAKESKAATGYFTPELLEYMDSREWKVLEANGMVGGPDAKESSDARQGFGKFLESAATGRPAGVEAPDGRAVHSKDEIEVFSSIVQHYSKDDHPGMPSALQRPISRVLSDYSESIYEIVGKWKTTSTSAELPLNVYQLKSMISAVSADPVAHRIVLNSQAAEIARQFDKNLDESDFSAENGYKSRAPEHARVAGTVLGVIDEARANAIGADLVRSLKEADLNKLKAYHAAGAIITPIPVVGDAMQRALDSILYAYTEGAKEEFEQAKEGKLKKLHRHGIEMLQELIKAKASQYPGTPEDTASGRQRALNHGLDAYNTGGGIMEKSR